jgi:hypothetical protein
LFEAVMVFAEFLSIGSLVCDGGNIHSRLNLDYREVFFSDLAIFLRAMILRMTVLVDRALLLGSMLHERANALVDTVNLTVKMPCIVFFARAFIRRNGHTGGQDHSCDRTDLFVKPGRIMQ